MRSQVRRHALVAGLILAAGLAATAVSGESRAAPDVPAAADLVGQSGWRVITATPPAGSGLVYRQWLLQDASRHQALMYLGVTARVPDLLRWSPELGYLGSGYLVVAHRDARVAVGDSRAAPVGEVAVQHLSDRRILQFALVGPHGAGRQARDLAPMAFWDAALGRAPTYYVIRVATEPGPAEEAAGANLLALVLQRLT